MKQALVVDRSGTLADFASSTLREDDYLVTVVDSLQLALALVSGAPYDMIMIAQQELCAEVLWRMVASIRRLSSETALILVQAKNADRDFYVRAGEVGATVLHIPQDVAVHSAIQEATPG